MKVSIEKASPSALDLMGRVLRSHGSIASEYPLIFREDLPGRLVTLSEDGAVRSACAILERDLAIGRVRLRAGLIGSVSTDPAFRRRGFAGRVLKAAEAELAGQGCVLSILWADEPGFYQEHGYREFGAEVDFVIPCELAARMPEPTGVRKATAADVSALHHVYMRHAERVERSEPETAAMMQSQGLELFVVERGGEPVAYACLGRGADLQDVVHEWGGAVEDVLRLVRGFIEARLDRGDDNDLFLMAPFASAAALAPLERLGAPSVRGILGQAKILDPEAARRLFVSLAPDVACEVTRRASDTVFRLRGPTGSAELDPREMLGVLIATRGERSAVARVEEDLGAALERLPLHPFVWGLDSI
jgi:GNAT superfamily N-acetyltransferase